MRATISFLPKPWVLLLAAAALTHPACASRPRVVLVSGEFEYSSMLTFPALRDALARDQGLDCICLQRTEGEHIPGLEALDRADLVIGMIRRMTLPPDELAYFRKYLEAGRPLIGLRTMCHAFENWKEFDHDVLGGNYHGHYRLTPTVRVAAAARSEPLLAGVPDSFLSGGVLYKTAPLAAGTHVLLEGMGEAGTAPEPLAWTHRYHGGRIFFSTLGHPGDFAQPAVIHLLVNAIDWALDRPPGAGGRDPVPLTHFPVKTVDLQLFHELVAARSCLLLDLRPAAEFARGHIKGARNLPAGENGGFPTGLSPEIGTTYVVYGGTEQTADEMHQMGFGVVYHFAGPFSDWEKAGLPVERSGG